MKNRIKMGISIGGPTIIMIFVVLCLVTLGTLSLVTANADMKLTLKNADSIKAYYAADSQGEEFLSRVDTALEHASEVQGSASFLSSIEENLSDIPDIGIELLEGDALAISRSIRINERQSLSIHLSVSIPPPDAGRKVKIESWKVTNEEYWNYEEYNTEFEDIIIPE